MRRWGRQRAGARPNLPKRSAPAGAFAGRRGDRGRPRPVRKIVAWLAVAFLGGWGAAAVYREGRPLVASWFEVREVTVIGASHVTRKEVLERLSLQPGETLFSVRPAELAARLESHPWIEQATVGRRPFHALVVSLAERRAVAVLKTPRVSVLLDPEGQVLSVLTGADEPGLPMLVGIDPNELVQGETRARHAIRAGIRLAGVLRDAFEDRPQVDVSHPDHTVAEVQGLRFRFGPSAVEEQWDRYRTVARTFQAVRGEGRGERATPCAHASLPASPMADADSLPSGFRQAGPGNRCQEIDLRYQGKVIVRERG